jgi:hypothetical protein
LENVIANKFRKLEGRVDSIAARLLIHEMLLDTKKHAEILEAALKVAGGPEPLWEMTIDVEVDKRTVKAELEDHMKAEDAMIREIDEEKKKTKDEALKLLLDHFMEDEKKHHRNLEIIIDKAYKIDL